MWHVGDSGVVRAGAVDPADVVDLNVSGRRVRLRCLGLACCAVEVAEAIAELPLPRWTAAVGSDDAPVNVLVVAGTVTTALLPVVRRSWAELPEPRAAVAFGACTISGGPYWDSYAVVPGLREEVPGAVDVAGCPPRPDLLTEAVLLAVGHAVDDSSSGVFA